jgi:periplasmic divalent cation tolerance protein
VPATDVVLALTTCADEASAVALVRALVERRLVACGTLLPGARSVYRWRGAVEDTTEVVVLLKTTAARVDALREALPGLHTYEVPELLVFPAAGGLPAYLAWVAGEVE